jgi:hypothetical protein
MHAESVTAVPADYNAGVVPTLTSLRATDAP